MGRNRTLNKQDNLWGCNCCKGNKQDDVIEVKRGHLSCNLKDEHKPATGCVYGRTFQGRENSKDNGLYKY